MVTGNNHALFCVWVYDNLPLAYQKTVLSISTECTILNKLAGSKAKLPFYFKKYYREGSGFIVNNANHKAENPLTALPW
jgi:hypothetical protein